MQTKEKANLLKNKERLILIIIAYISMFIDHFAVILLPLFYHIPNINTYYEILRGIGRLAFPLFCLFLVEGFFATRNKLKYLLYIGIFAIISEIPFNLAFYNNIIFDIQHQSVMLTLLLGLILINIIDIICFKKNNIKWYDISIWLILTSIYAGIAYLLKTDYSLYGILSISIIYLLKKIGKEIPNSVIIIFAIMPLVYQNKIELIALVLVPIISLLDLLKQEEIKKKPNTIVKILKYSFYPVHLLLLYLILYTFS